MQGRRPKKRSKQGSKQENYMALLVKEAGSDDADYQMERGNIIASLTGLKLTYPSFDDVIDGVNSSSVINNQDMNIFKLQLAMLDMGEKESNKTYLDRDKLFRFNAINAIHVFESNIDKDAPFKQRNYIYRRDNPSDVTPETMKRWGEATRDLENKVKLLKRLMQTNMSEYALQTIAHLLLNSLSNHRSVFNDIQRTLIDRLQNDVNNFNKKFDPNKIDPTWEERERQLKESQLSGEVAPAPIAEEKIEIDRKRRVVDVEEADSVKGEKLLEEGKVVATEVSQLKGEYDELLNDIAMQDTAIVQMVKEINELRETQNEWIKLTYSVDSQISHNANYQPDWPNWNVGAEMPAWNVTEVPKVVELEKEHAIYSRETIILPILKGEKVKPDSAELDYKLEELEKYKLDNQKIKMHLEVNILQAKTTLEERKAQISTLKEKIKQEKDRLKEVAKLSRENLQIGKGKLEEQKSYLNAKALEAMKKVSEHKYESLKDVFPVGKPDERFNNKYEQIRRLVTEMDPKKAKVLFDAVDKYKNGDSSDVQKLRRKRFFEFRSTHLKRLALLNLLLTANDYKDKMDKASDPEKQTSIIIEGMKEISVRLRDGSLQKESKLSGLARQFDLGADSINKELGSFYDRANQTHRDKMRTIATNKVEKFSSIDEQLKRLDESVRMLESNTKKLAEKPEVTHQHEAHDQPHAQPLTSPSIVGASMFGHASPSQSAVNPEPIVNKPHNNG